MCTQFLESSLKHPLAKIRPVHTLFRYIKWQTLSRLTGKDLRFTIADKAKFISRRGWPVSNAAYYYGLSEFETMTFLLHFLKNDDLFVDAGAHIGTYSVLLAALTGAMVIAFEPHPGAYAFLEEHIRLNDLENRITAHNCALGDIEADVSMTNDLGLNNFLTPDDRSQNIISTHVTTLDAMCDKAPAAIKIDVEGFELMVLRGADRILQDPALMVVCVETMGLGERYGYDDEQVLEYLEKFGFKAIHYQAFERRMMPSTKKSGMAICIRDDESVRRRIVESGTININGLRI